MSLEDFEHATAEEGCQYEIIDGGIEVSYLPEFPHEDLENWIHQLLLIYCLRKPEIIVSPGEVYAKRLLPEFALIPEAVEQ